MLYTEFINKAKKLTVLQHEDGPWYLSPDWRFILHQNGLAVLKFKDYRPDWYIIEDTLKLEVEKRNAALENKKMKVIDWLHETITATVEPAMLAEETDFIGNVIDFMRVNHSIQNEQPIEEQSEKNNIVQFPKKD